ncbi:unnamed protein product [Prorocentrum cordatum]|uniref:Uncharacterized protein n=1 Tax=Prorocentrum cordatum TaxID=2364126 RepID=A0ABN9QMH7_9DINO|nr:unnamed protein product [Polarella glacialis]
MTKAAAGLKLSNSPGTAVQNTLRALQCRDAYNYTSVKNWSHVYQVAKNWLASGNLIVGRYNAYVKSRKIANKLDLNKVISDISKPCWKRDSEHTCLDAFRHHPEAVLQWRQMWHSLPKHDRAQRLAAEYAQAFEAHTARRMGDSTCFQMQYRIFGRKVCRDAFIALTGMHACTLQDARNLAVGAKMPALPHGLGSWVCSRPLTYMNARAWLVAYAKANADTSPMNDRLWLPAGRKQDYFAVYFHDRTSKNADPAHIASQSYFLKVWRQELPWLQLRAASGPFTHCGFCDFLHMLITEAKDQYVKDLLLRKLGQHYEFQAAQRMAMNQLFAESERHPEELVTVGWDKMDQAKTILPRVKALSNTQFQKGGSRLIVHLIGAKRWLTTCDWCKPIVLCPGVNIPEIREWWAPPLVPEWPEKFVNSHLARLKKLQALLEQAGRDCSNHLDYMRKLVNDELPEYLPSGQPLEEKINLVRKNAKRGMGQASQLVKGVDTDALDKAIAAAFPGSSAAALSPRRHATMERRRGASIPSLAGALAAGATACWAARRCFAAAGAAGSLRLSAEPRPGAGAGPEAAGGPPADVAGLHLSSAALVLGGVAAAARLRRRTSRPAVPSVFAQIMARKPAQTSPARGAARAEEAPSEAADSFAQMMSRRPSFSGGAAAAAGAAAGLASSAGHAEAAPERWWSSLEFRSVGGLGKKAEAKVVFADLKGPSVQTKLAMVDSAAPVARVEAAAPRLEARALAPEARAPAQAAAPTAEAPAPAAQAKAPAAEAPAPAVGAKVPAGEAEVAEPAASTKLPAAGAKASAGEAEVGAKAGATEAKAPLAEAAKAPSAGVKESTPQAKAAAVEAKAPAAQATAPAAEAKAPAMEAKTLAAETKALSAQAKAPAAEAKAPAAEAKAPAAEAKAPAVEVNAPVAEAKVPVVELKTSPVQAQVVDAKTTQATAATSSMEAAPPAQQKLAAAFAEAAGAPGGQKAAAAAAEASQSLPPAEALGDAVAAGVAAAGVAEQQDALGPIAANFAASYLAGQAALQDARARTCDRCRLLSVRTLAAAVRLERALARRLAPPSVACGMAGQRRGPDCLGWLTRPARGPARGEPPARPTGGWVLRLTGGGLPPLRGAAEEPARGAESDSSEAAEAWVAFRRSGAQAWQAHKAAESASRAAQPAEQTGQDSQEADEGAESAGTEDASEEADEADTSRAEDAGRGRQEGEADTSRESDAEDADEGGPLARCPPQPGAEAEELEASEERAAEDAGRGGEESEAEDAGQEALAGLGGDAAQPDEGGELPSRSPRLPGHDKEAGEAATAGRGEGPGGAFLVESSDDEDAPAQQGVANLPGTLGSAAAAATEAAEAEVQHAQDQLRRLLGPGDGFKQTPLADFFPQAAPPPASCAPFLLAGGARGPKPKSARELGRARAQKRMALSLQAAERRAKAARDSEQGALPPASGGALTLSPLQRPREPATPGPSEPATPASRLKPSQAPGALAALDDAAARGGEEGVLALLPERGRPPGRGAIPPGVAGKNTPRKVVEARKAGGVANLEPPTPAGKLEMKRLADELAQQALAGARPARFWERLTAETGYTQTALKRYLSDDEQRRAKAWTERAAEEASRRRSAAATPGWSRFQSKDRGVRMGKEGGRKKTKSADWPEQEEAVCQWARSLLMLGVSLSDFDLLDEFTLLLEEEAWDLQARAAEGAELAQAEQDRLAALTAHLAELAEKKGTRRYRRQKLCFHSQLHLRTPSNVLPMLPTEVEGFLTVVFEEPPEEAAWRLAREAEARKQKQEKDEPDEPDKDKDEPDEARVAEAPAAMKASILLSAAARTEARLERDQKNYGGEPGRKRKARQGGVGSRERRTLERAVLQEAHRHLAAWEAQLLESFPFLRGWGGTEALPEQWTPTQATDADWLTRRVPAFLSWLREQPERQVVVVGHGAYFMGLLGWHMQNCEVAELVDVGALVRTLRSARPPQDRRDAAAALGRTRRQGCAAVDPGGGGPADRPRRGDPRENAARALGKIAEAAASGGRASRAEALAGGVARLLGDADASVRAAAAEALGDAGESRRPRTPRRPRGC